jgi:tetratricopeptide (TPR) repeat protein
MRKVIPFFICLSTASVLSGMDLRTGLSSADALERSGNPAAALLQYETLYREYPSNPAVFARFKTFCLTQRMFDRGLDLIEDQKRYQPDEPSLDIDQGVVLYRMNRREDALSVWKNLIDRRPDQPLYYYLITAAMIREGLLHEAVGIYEQGERHVKNPGMFNAQLADLHLNLKEYDQAADRILSGYLIRPDIRVLQDFFSRFPKTEPVLGGLSKRIEKMNAPSERRAELDGLCLRMFLDSRLFKPAFRTVHQIRDLSQAKGRNALFLFGQAALDAKEWDWAERAFQESLSIQHNREEEAVSLWGLAQTAEGRGDTDDALLRYNRVVQSHPQGETAFRAWMRIGSILHEKGETGEAVRSFERAANAFMPLRIRAWIELGACLVDKGEWDSAGTVFGNVLGETRQGSPDWIRALRNSAEVEYYAGRFDTSLSILKRIDGLKSDSTALAFSEFNDALDFRIRLEELSKYPEFLNTLAKGEWLLRVRRHREARTLLDSLARSNPDMEPIALLREADACVALGQSMEAAALLDQVWKNHPGSMEAEAALEKSGEIFREGGNLNQALERFETFLERYPQSQRLGRIRERIRELGLKS